MITCSALMCCTCVSSSSLCGFIHSVSSLPSCAASSLPRREISGSCHTVPGVFSTFSPLYYQPFSPADLDTFACWADCQCTDLCPIKKNPELLSCLFGGSIETSFKSNIEYERFCTLEVQNVLCRERVWAGSELCADLERVSRGNSGNILSQKHPSKTGKLGVEGATRGFSSSKTGLNSPSRGVWWRGAGLWDHYWHFWCNTSAQVSKAACCVAGWLIWTRAGCFFWNFHCNLSCFVRPCVIIMCGVCVKLSAGALSSLIMCVVH